MRVLRYLLLALGVLGAVFTFPNSVINPFTPVFLGCLGLIWFAWGLGKPKEAPESPQSTQAASLQDH